MLSPHLQLSPGAGNTPAFIAESADIQMAVSSILLSKTFDNGVICASEQSVVVDHNIYDAVRMPPVEFIHLPSAMLPSLGVFCFPCFYTTCLNTPCMQI